MDQPPRAGPKNGPGITYFVIAAFELTFDERMQCAALQRCRSQQAVLFYYHIEVFAAAVILALLYDSVRKIVRTAGLAGGLIKP